MALEKLQSICELNKIKSEITGENIYIYLGKKRDEVKLKFSKIRATFLMNDAPDFYEYKFIEEYEAIWSTKNKTIECGIIAPDFSISSINGQSILLRALTKTSVDYDEDDDSQQKIEIKSPIPESSIEISQASTAYIFLCVMKNRNFVSEIFANDKNIDIQSEKFFNQMVRLKQRSTTIKLKNAEIKYHDEAQQIVSDIFSSICFQINCSTNISTMLSLETKKRLRVRNRHAINLKKMEIKYVYDHEALSLYWYAQSAINMPLLQFLAFYQTIEFYYSIYSTKATQERVKNIIKHPLFDIENDKDLSRLINTIKNKNSSPILNSERDQLITTLTACINIEDLRELLKTFINQPESTDSKSTKQRYWFTSQNAIKISKKTIAIDTKDDAALLNQVMERVYNIRCRIVHTNANNSKNLEDDFDILHPRSKEIQHIENDIALVSYLALNVISTSGKPYHYKPTIMKDVQEEVL